MAISPLVSVGELVVQQPDRARVFERLGIDYCCHGGNCLADACEAAGLNLEEVQHELEEADAAPHAPEEDWSAVSLGRLIDHIVEIHHNFLRSELARLEKLLAKVALHHGLRHHNLLALAEAFLAMKEELLNHMLKEEQVLFPMVRRLEAGQPAPFTVNNPITVMEAEHRHVGEALERMRFLTQDFATPSDGCASYQALMTGLAELEEDLHQHIHKENNILFPRAEKLERSREDVYAS